MVPSNFYDRERQRKHRCEHQAIVELLKTLQFEYVVKENIPARICFNSGRERFPKILKELPVPFNNPQTCEKGNDPQSSVFASTVPRFPEQGHSFFSISKLQGEMLKNFKCHTFRKTPNMNDDFLYDQRTLNPGPGTYSLEALRPKKTSVLVICASNHFYNCFLCFKEISSGCFWRNLLTDQNLCRSCMKQEAHVQKPHRVMLRYTKSTDLEKFVRVRICNFYHKHEGTPVAVHYISPKEIRKRFQRVDYLNKYSNFLKIQ